MLPVQSGEGVTLLANPAESRMKSAMEKFQATCAAPENNNALTGSDLEE